MKEKSKEPDLIEKIAYGLPLEVRAEFLNEMRYLRSLPENDELLRILRVMQFLTLMMEQVPNRVLTEREKLENTWREVTVTAKRLEKIGSEYYQQLNQQLCRLPEDIFGGINPKEIVECINGNLKKQFNATTIPIIANELAANAKHIKTATMEYTRASSELCDSWRSAADEAHNAIDKIQTAISGAVETSKKAAIKLSKTFDRAYHWSLGISFVLGAAFGSMVGIVIFNHFR